MEIKTIATGSSGNCYLVADGATRLLLDAGIPIAIISEGCDYQLAKIAACLVTHIHKDHSRAVKDLSRRGVLVYGTAEMRENKMPVRDVSLYQGRLKGIYCFNVGTFEIRAFRVPHDCECYGYLIHSNKTDERLVYLTDLSEIPFRFNDVDYWLVEANYSLDILDKNVENGTDAEYANRVINTHLSVEKLEQYFRTYEHMTAREIILIHLSDGNSDADDFRRRIERASGCAVIVA